MTLGGNIRTVILDLGGVCFTDGTAAFIRELNELYGISQAEADRVLRGDLGSHYREGKISSKQFWDTARQELELKDTNVDLDHLWASKYQIQPGIRDLLISLSRRGIQRLYLSDNTRNRAEYLEETYGFMELFSGGVFSFNLGTRKPNPMMYEAVLRLSVNPAAHCLYVDDYEAFLKPAIALGMQTYRFESVTALRELLSAQGLLR